VDASILKTENIVNVGWQTAVQCEIDHPCCEVNEVEWKNIQTQITQTETKIVQKQTQLDILTREITKMVETCPDVDFNDFVIPEDVVVEEAPLPDDIVLDEPEWEEPLLGGDPSTWPTAIVDEPLPEITVLEEPDWEEHVVETCVTDFSSYWSNEISPNFVYDYVFPENPCYDNQLIAFKDAAWDTAFDFAFENAGASSNMNDGMWNPEWEECVWFDFVSDQISSIDIYYVSAEDDTQLVRKLAFWDANGNELYMTPKDATTFPEVRIEVVSLMPGERVIGVKGDTSHSYNGRTGYWRNLQFLIGAAI
jgi:hypothetical protein